MKYGAQSMLVTLLLAVAASAQPVGDCNRSGAVSADELTAAVDIALGGAPLSDCGPLDRDGDERASVDELLFAVDNARGISTLPDRLAFVIATDFQTGSFATVGLDAPRTVTPASPSRRVHGDAVARQFAGMVYVLNRFGADNVQLLDPGNNFATRWQCSTGGGSNPNDVAFASATKAYVALFARAQMLVINPNPKPDCSDFLRGSIDLSAYADADGIPEMNALAVVGSRLYVSLERLQNFVPADHGALVVIDTATDQVLNEIPLTGDNPFGESKGLTVVENSIVVSEVGVFGTNDGGLERVELASEAAQGFFVSEADLGGDITDFVLVSDQLGYAIVSNVDFTSDLVAFNPMTRSITATLASQGNFADIELNDRGELYLSDRSLTTPGIRVFRASDGIELTTHPVAIGLPPFDIVFVP